MVAVVFALLPVHPEAWAQSGAASPDRPIVLAQNKEFRGFNPFRALGRIFGGGDRRKSKKAPQKRRKASRPAGVPPKFEEAEKDPDAGLILVVGDRMARGVADGLRFTLAQQPKIKVEQITEDKKGFAGDEPPAWATKTVSKIRGAEVKAVVVMIGWRDRDKSFAGSELPIEYMTAEWLNIYRNRVSALVRTVRQEKIPVVWVGLPPTNDELLNGDFTQLNSIYAAAAEERRVRYVDLWDIFLAEDGSYTSYGPDVDGKNTRLRTKDRIGFTWPGYRKVAFFVERELSRLLGGYGGLAFEGVEDDPNFIVLTGRTTSPEAFLLGGEDDAEIDTSGTAYRFFVEGEQLPPVRGRVDDPRTAREDLSNLMETSANGS